MQCWSHLPVLALLLLGGHALGQVVGDTTIGETTIENSENLEHYWLLSIEASRWVEALKADIVKQ